MVDIVSIIIAVISLTGTLLTTGITAWFGYFSDKRKRLRESEQLLSKYRDPLLLACQDLQSRLYNITDYNITDWYWLDDRGYNENENKIENFDDQHNNIGTKCDNDPYISKDKDKRDNLLLYTTFAVGQYFSWTHILRRQAQFLRFSIDETDKKLTKVMAQIRWEFGTDRYPVETSGPFMLWKGEQMAVGEVMTIKEDGGNELHCMGYAAFRERWARNQPERQQDGTGVGLRTMDEDKCWTGDFRPWFRSIVEGVVAIARAKAKLGETERFSAKGKERRKDKHQGTGQMNASEEGPSLAPGSTYSSLIVPRAAISIQVPDHRLRRIQHLLLDLIQILDPKGLRSEAKWTAPCQPAPHCSCSNSTVCPWQKAEESNCRTPQR